MGNNKEVLSRGGMQFFSKMSASATHEIKNTLAIINESAGLLEDLSMMGEKGKPLSPERVNDISQRVIRQVQRANFVLKKMNQFSHSVDRKTQIADLEETVCFVLDLASRLIEMQGVVIKVTSPLSRIMVETNLFYLENMIWKAIETACFAAKEKKQVVISFGTDVAVPSIWFSMDLVKDNLMDDLFGSKEDCALIAHLNISIKKNKANYSFGLLWPKRFNPITPN
ncbi:hypothetical protein [Desulfobacula sp.]|uniref:hypothetical protein n=1 Tax=Desulfobacula sp. TaxID=2593537 RepID=UPI0025C6821C|nr:hypothetical protein [Desulfobacula sp.]MBC2703214.1 hypothetical protein [Desulfobacula sp.]